MVGNSATQSRQFFISAPATRIILIPPRFRVKKGDVVELFDANGNIKQAQVLSFSKSASELKILPDGADLLESPKLQSEFKQSAGFGVRLSLAVGMPKAARGDWLVEQAVQLGVANIIPLTTQHGVLKLETDAESSNSRIERWRRLAIAAAKQSLTPEIPSVFDPHSLDQLLTPKRFDLILWGCMPSDPVHKPISLLSLSPSTFAPPKNMLLCIGPEGDFSSAEKTLLSQVGAIPAWVSTNRLRVETAAVAIVAAAQLLMSTAAPKS